MHEYLFQKIREYLDSSQTLLTPYLHPETIMCGGAKRKLELRCLCIWLHVPCPSNFVSQTWKDIFVKDIFTKTIKLAQPFRNNHVDNELISKERFKLYSPSQTIKYYTNTLFKGFSVLCRFVLVNKYVIVSLFYTQRAFTAEERVLELAPSSKATKVMLFSREGTYWSRLQRITTFFNFLNYLVTFLEGETCPISYCLLSFGLILESLG